MKHDYGKLVNAEWGAQSKLLRFDDIPKTNDESKLREHFILKYQTYLEYVNRMPGGRPRVSPEAYYLAIAPYISGYRNPKSPQALLPSLRRTFHGVYPNVEWKSTPTIVTVHGPFVERIYSHENPKELQKVKQQIHMMFDDTFGGMCQRPEDPKRAGIAKNYFNNIFNAKQVFVFTAEGMLNERPGEKWPVAFLIMKGAENGDWELPVLCSHVSGNTFVYLFSKALEHLNNNNLIQSGSVIRLEATIPKLVRYYAQELQFVPEGLNNPEDLKDFFSALFNLDTTAAFLDQHKDELQSPETEAWKMQLVYSLQYLQFLRVQAERFVGWEQLFEKRLDNFKIKLLNGPICDQCATSNVLLEEANDSGLYFCNSVCQRAYHC